jgi:hypothetical protein
MRSLLQLLAQPGPPDMSAFAPLLEVKRTSSRPTESKNGLLISFVRRGVIREKAKNFKAAGDAHRTSGCELYRD